MKNLMTAVASTFVFATVVAPTFADTINPCPQGSSFSALCNNTDRFEANKVIQTAVSLLLLAAVLIALFFLIFGGIKWILSGGDKGKVDAARGTIVGAIIGLVIALAAFFVLNLVAKVFGLGSITNLTIPTF